MVNINRLIREAGVIWHPCSVCFRDWPFPTGSDPQLRREFICVCCVNALLASLRRKGLVP